MTSSEPTTLPPKTPAIIPVHSPEELEKMALLLSDSPDFVIIRRFVAKDVYAAPDDTQKKVAMFFDTETTGLDVLVDDVFEIGYVMAEYNPTTGDIYRILGRYSGFSDPGYPLPEIITQLTGVATSEITGHKFDDATIRADASRADLIIAQNAGFDRKMIERIYPEFVGKPWACTVNDGPWDEMKYSIKKQEFLALKAARVFYDAHRALTDAEVLLHITTMPSHDGRPILAHILEKARNESYCVWAIGAAFETKDILKGAGYRWSDGTVPGKPKSWYKETTDVDAEIDFLAENVYKRRQTIEVDLMTPYDRYSTRYTERIQREVNPAPRKTTQLR